LSYFVVEVDDRGRPTQVIIKEDIDDAKQLAAEIARENGVTVTDIRSDIWDDENNPGTYYSESTDDVAGVWVLEPVPSVLGDDDDDE